MAIVYFPTIGIFEVTSHIRGFSTNKHKITILLSAVK